MFRLSKNLFRLLVLSCAVNGALANETQTPELPSYCANFPAIKGDLDNLKDNLIDRGAGEVAYTLCTEDGQRVPVEVMDIMDHWAGVQNVQYDDRVKQFEEKLRKKVFAAVAASMYPYSDLYERKDCGKINAPERSRGVLRRDCEAKQDFVPKCNNPEYQQILESKAQDYDSFRESEARSVLGAVGLKEFNSEEVEKEAVNEAYDHLDEQKKLNFMKSHIQNSLLVDKLLKEREKEVERFEKEMDASSLSCRDICNSSWGPGQQGAARCSRCIDEKGEAKAQVEKNHEMQLAQIQTSLGKIYESSPALFELENDINFSFSNLVSSRYEKSDFSKKLEQQALDTKPELQKMDLKEIENFVTSVDGQSALAQTAAQVISNESSEIENLGRSKVFEEKRNKKEALEKLCQGDIDGLHHFPGVAESIIADSMKNAKNSNANLVQDQAAYCYLLQTRPPGEEGGLGLGAVLGASALIVGGVVVQFVPGLGQVAGVGAFGVAAGIVGGGVLAVDSYDRYDTSSSQYESTQAAYHGSTAWANSTQLLESKDKMMTDRAIAAAEVGLVAVDGVLVVRPAVTLAKRLGRRGISSSSKQRPRDVSPASKSNRPEISDQAPITPRSNPGEQQSGVQAGRSTGETVSQRGAPSQPMAPSNRTDVAKVVKPDSSVRPKVPDETPTAPRSNLGEQQPGVQVRGSTGRTNLQRNAPSQPPAPPNRRDVAKVVKPERSVPPRVPDEAPVAPRSNPGGQQSGVQVGRSTGGARPQRDAPSQLPAAPKRTDVANVVKPRNSMPARVSDQTPAAPRPSSVEQQPGVQVGRNNGRTAPQRSGPSELPSAPKNTDVAMTAKPQKSVQPKVYDGEVLDPEFKTPSTQVRQGETIEGTYTVVGDDTVPRLEGPKKLEGPETDKLPRIEDRTSTSTAVAPRVYEPDDIYTPPKQPKTPSTEVRQGETIDGVPYTDLSLRKGLEGEAPKKLDPSKKDEPPAVGGSPPRARTTASKSNGSEAKANRTWLSLGLGALGALKSSQSDIENGSDGNSEDKDGPTTANDTEGPIIKIRIMGVSDPTKLIEKDKEDLDFSVEAYVDPEGSEQELPVGKFKWSCKGEDNLCEDSGFQSEGDTQSLKLFDRTPYTLTVEYVQDEPELKTEPLVLEDLQIKCRTNAAGTQCVSDDEREASRETAGDEEEYVREPFWWESLPPNAPPPQFKPGPPMKMRTFILPGAI